MLILGGNQLAAGGYEVANSLRFDDGSSDYLSRTPSSTGNTKKFTISFWCKRSALGTDQDIFHVYPGSGERSQILFLSDDTLQVELEAANVNKLVTSRVFRDPSAWMHIVVVYDSDNGTSGNRVILYVNGVRETSFSTENYPSSGATSGINTTTQHEISSYDGAGYFYDGYLSEFVLLDGIVADPTSFGEFDEDTGIWKPIDVSGLTFGTNGFYLDFENSGSLGADVSGNGNNFTVNNLTAIDSVSDVPTNNFATLNPLIYSSASKTYSEGNTAISTSDSGNWCATQNNIGVSSGKWYMEIKITNKAYLFAVGVGFNPLDSNGSNVTAFINSTYLVGEDTGTYGWRDNGALPQGGTSISTYTTNDILMIALDMDNLKVYFGKNGTWENSGDPTSGATETGSMGNLTAGEDYFFIVTPRNGSASVNFGSPAFAISSGNTDGNSYGNFEYAVPSGYYALNTKNLAEYG